MVSQVGIEKKVGTSHAAIFIVYALDFSWSNVEGLTSGKGLFRFFYKKPEVLKEQAKVYDMKVGSIRKSKILKVFFEYACHLHTLKECIACKGIS